VFCVLVKSEEGVRMSHSFLLGTIILKKDTCLDPSISNLSPATHTLREFLTDDGQF